MSCQVVSKRSSKPSASDDTPQAAASEVVPETAIEHDPPAALPAGIEDTEDAQPHSDDEEAEQEGNSASDKAPDSPADTTKQRAADEPPPPAEPVPNTAVIAPPTPAMIPPTPCSDAGTLVSFRVRASVAKAVESSGPKQCWFECGETAGLLNIGNYRSERWVCSACNAARRGIDAQARDRSQPSVKAELKNLKEQRQGDYKAKVRSARVVAAPEGQSLRNARAAAIGRFTQSIEQTVSVEDCAVVLWLDKPDYIQRLIQRGASEAAAAAQWTADVSDPGIKRRGSGQSLRLAVSGTPTTTAKVAKTFRRSVVAERDMHNEAELSVANKRMRLAAVQDVAQSTAFSDVGGDVFRSGAASGEVAPSVTFIRGPAPSTEDMPDVSISHLEDTALALSAEPAKVEEVEDSEVKVSETRRILLFTPTYSHILHCLNTYG